MHQGGQANENQGLFFRQLAFQSFHFNSAIEWNYLQLAIFLESQVVDRFKVLLLYQNNLILKFVLYTLMCMSRNKLFILKPSFSLSFSLFLLFMTILCHVLLHCKSTRRFECSAGKTKLHLHRCTNVRRQECSIFHNTYFPHTHTHTHIQTQAYAFFVETLFTVYSYHKLPTSSYFRMPQNSIKY